MPRSRRKRVRTQPDVETSVDSPGVSKTAAAPSDESRGKWASLADRLNPTRPSFDPVLKAQWATMGKLKRKKLLAADRKAIAELRQRGKAAQQGLPFDADPDDHCESPPTAYAHAAPLLRLLASRLGKAPECLSIYDPYFCAGAAKRHLNVLGFAAVHNEPEDFYATCASGTVPLHDVIVTNPPYSGDHFGRLLQFLRDNRKPFLLLLPAHFGAKKCYSEARLSGWFDPFGLLPPKRYHYWTPIGLRPGSRNEKGKHKNLHLGERNSPFDSHWFVSLSPVIDKEQVMSGRGHMLADLVDGTKIIPDPAIVQRNESTSHDFADGLTLKRKRIIHNK